MVFYQVFLLSNSQFQAVEISSSRKLKVGSKIRIAWRKSLQTVVPITSKNSASGEVAQSLRQDESVETKTKEIKGKSG
jgi:hypothetical protein